MRILFSLLMMFIIPAIMVVGVFYLIAKALMGITFNPDSNVWKRMVELLRTQLKAQSGTLVPWDGEMLSLLSLNRTDLRKPGFFRSVSSGVFTTVYQEPILSYISQQSGKDRVIIAHTSDRELILRQKIKETEIWVDGKPFALFIDGVLLAAGTTGRLLARFEAAPEEALWPVVLEDKTGAAINNPARSDGPNPRAFTLLRTLNNSEENIILALMLLKTV